MKHDKKMWAPYTSMHFRMNESLRIMDDAFVLLLDNRYISAFVLMRCAFESITHGAFYHFLQLSEYRSFLPVLKERYGKKYCQILRQGIEEDIESRNGLCFSLGFEAIIADKLEKAGAKSYPPSFGTMYTQLLAWDIFSFSQGDREFDMVGHGYRQLYRELSKHTHTILPNTYMAIDAFRFGKGEDSRLNLTLLPSFDAESFEESYRLFQLTLDQIGMFFLAVINTALHKIQEHKSLNVLQRSTLLKTDFLTITYHLICSILGIDSSDDRKKR